MFEKRKKKLLKWHSFLDKYRVRKANKTSHQWRIYGNLDMGKSKKGRQGNLTKKSKPKGIRNDRKRSNEKCLKARGKQRARLISKTLVTSSMWEIHSREMCNFWSDKEIKRNFEKNIANNCGHRPEVFLNSIYSKTRSKDKILDTIITRNECVRPKMKNKTKRLSSITISRAQEKKEKISYKKDRHNESERTSWCF